MPTKTVAAQVLLGKAGLEQVGPTQYRVELLYRDDAFCESLRHSVNMQPKSGWNTCWRTLPTHTPAAPY